MTSEKNVFNVRVDQSGDIRCNNIASKLIGNISLSKKTKYCNICYRLYAEEKIKMGKLRVLISGQDLGQCEVRQ